MRDRRSRAIPLGLAAAAILAALLQRPGETSADTKIDLHVDPVGFLGDVMAVWTNSGAFGEVQGGQYAGYLFPMGPFFALGHLLGLPDWLVDRLWIGVILALAAWGTVRLLDALMPGPRGAAHVVAGALMVFNPYTVVYVDRTSVTLLGVAALPWLMLAVQRGLRTPRGWWWPAAIALIVTCAGAGVNAAVTAWILLGPVALALYEWGRGAVDRRAVVAFTLRVVALGIPACAWWLGPVLIQTLYGIDFLQFTEQPGAIWASTSLSESFRLMGYWPSYLGVGYGSLLPFYETSPDLLFAAPVVAATLLVPALALSGFAAGRRWVYGPFFLGLLLLGLLVMAVGFPEGTPLRKGVTFAYNTLSPIQFLRTTHKAGPLVALALACLGGAGAAALARRHGRGALAAMSLAGVVLVAVAIFPITRGKAVDGQLTYDRIPSAWERTASDLDRGAVDGNHRALVLPGQLLAYYRWGQTVDAILPALTDRPVAVRQFVPRADVHSAELLIAVDALVQQERLLPGQLKPLLRLLGVQQVITGTDDAPGAGTMPAADAARVLSGQGLGRAEAAYGALRAFSGADGAFEPVRRLPEVRRHRVAGARGIVRVLPAGPETVVDGSAEGVTALAAFGALPRDRPLFYAADRDPAQLRRAAAQGADLVVTDSNRRRVFVPARIRQNAGATLAAGDPISEDAALLDPFPDRGPAAQTVARVTGARYVRSPFSPQFPQLPENRPTAALDGSTRTEWLGDTHLDAPRRWLEVGFRSPRNVPYVDVLPAGGRATTVAAVDIAGRRHPVKPGWNRIPLGLRGATDLRLTLVSRGDPRYLRSGNGLAEVRIPGLRVREQLRPPTVLQSALRGRDIRRSDLTYLFARTTGDRPAKRDAGRRPVRNGAPAAFEDPEARRTRDATDGEVDLRRRLDPPAARAYRVDAWTTLSPRAPDSRVDRLAGTTGGRFDSSGRFQGRPRFRASEAFDADPGTAWVADRLEAGRPWLAWRTAEPRTIRRLRLTAADLPARTPTRVRVRGGGRASPVVAVGPSGAIALPAPLTARAFRLEVVASSPSRRPRGDTPATVAVAGLTGRGVPVARRGPPGRLPATCGVATVRTAGGPVPLRLTGTVADLEAGRALRARGCGAARRLPAGGQDLSTRAGVVRVDHLRLRSAAPAGPPARRGGGAVVDAGRTRRGRHDDVRVRVDGPAWLVLGETFNRGWRARCGDRDLGPPQVIDGYANGWPAPRDCRDVTIAFAPQRAVNVGYLVSIVACALLLCLLLLRRPGREEARATVPFEPPAAPRPWGLPAAAAAGLGAGLASGFLFGLRTGPGAALLVGLVLWRAVGWRPLLAGAVVLLGVVVPAAYLLFPPADLGGYNSDYAASLVGAHWIAVAAFLLLVLTLVRSLPLSRARGRRGGPAPAPPAAVAARSRP